jgi:hypothetical protein
MTSWMNTFYMDDVQWKLPQLFYFTWELPGAAAVAGSQTACRARCPDCCSQSPFLVLFANSPRLDRHAHELMELLAKTFLVVIFSQFASKNKVN